MAFSPIAPYAKFIKGRSTAILSLYTQDGEGKYEVFIDGVFGVSLNGTFTIGAPPVVKGPEISVRQGRELTDGKSTTNFGYVRVSKTSKAKVYTIKNTGKSPLKNLGFTVGGKNKADFILSSPKIGDIGPDESVEIRVMFKPKEFGKRKAVLHILSNDKDEKSFDINLAGSGVGIK